jgi:hypothetical protein
VDSRRNHVVLGGGVKVERTVVAPIAHQAKPVEKRHVAVTGDDTHVIGVSIEMNHRLGPRTVLHVDENDIRVTGL